MMNLETRGSTAQTLNLDIAQCQRAEPKPGKAADSWTLAMRVRQYLFVSSHASRTRVSDTTLCSAVENHTKGESSTRDPLVLVLRG